MLKKVLNQNGRLRPSTVDGIKIFDNDQAPQNITVGLDSDTVYLYSDTLCIHTVYTDSVYSDTVYTVYSDTVCTLYSVHCI